MAVFEPYLVEIIVQLVRMRCPITVGTGLHLANSLIKGTTIARDLVEWKLKHNIQTRAGLRMTASSNSCADNSESSHMIEDKTPHSGMAFLAADEVEHVLGQTLAYKRPHQKSRTPPDRLGLGYWNSFMRRNKHIIRSKQCVKFEAKRAEWCTYTYFLVMYEEVCKAMTETGIASKLDTKVMLDKSGEIVEHKSEAFGLPTEYMMQRPDKLVFVDEVGSNNSTTKDGNVGGEKFLCEASGRPKIKAATKDSHFTVMGFTAATGEPVMCAIIFEAMKMCPSWVLGLNASAPWIGEENNLQQNTGGINKRHPQGPVCRFRGKDVPTFCYCSENGSTTAEILVDMLSVMDKMQLFDRSDGVPPFLLLDGHGSRFDLKFLRYVNNPTTK
jgi:hypothetical protein